MRVDIDGVPETMLMTLHNRAHEARRPDTYLEDPDCLRIYDAIDYDYEGHFGKPNDSHPMRSLLFDGVVKQWMANHRGGTVVELAAGLETQFQRIDDGHVQWLCVDLPESLAVRERFLPSSKRCRYVGKSALDLSWFDEVDGSHSVFVSAQGILMYFEQSEIERLYLALIERFPGVELMFDTIPRWLSKKSLTGWEMRKGYVTPRMPWGISGPEVDLLLRSWSTRTAHVHTQPYGFARGPKRALVWGARFLPGLENTAPSITHVTTVA
ncbi:class I SAM-dependent methyltransferase [Rhodococcus sp. NPDC058521]|uniref:class I SAM-dependent methyltransferase n=1 Tax=Rhodococcus sp. NPDC058521 TaxID=3346536 RepID=UPI003646BEBF